MIAQPARPHAPMMMANHLSDPSRNRELIEERHIMVPMRDGVCLATDVWRPRHRPARPGTGQPYSVLQGHGRPDVGAPRPRRRPASPSCCRTAGAVSARRGVGVTSTARSMTVTTPSSGRPPNPGPMAGWACSVRRTWAIRSGWPLWPARRTWRSWPRNAAPPTTGRRRSTRGAPSGWPCASAGPPR